MTTGLLQWTAESNGPADVPIGSLLWCAIRSTIWSNIRRRCREWDISKGKVDCKHLEMRVKIGGGVLEKFLQVGFLNRISKGKLTCDIY